MRATRPHWAGMEPWDGLAVGAFAEKAWAIADFQHSLGVALPDWFFGAALQELAARRHRRLLFPPGVDTLDEYRSELRAMGHDDVPEGFWRDIGWPMREET